MIKNNLAKIMIDRNIKATTISNETGIARSTISRLSNNNSEKIDLSILNTLCTVLKITPDVFFEYHPIDYSFTFEIGEMITDEDDARRNFPLDYEVFGFINYTKYHEKWFSVEYSGTLELIHGVNRVKGNTVDGIHVAIKPHKEEDDDFVYITNISKARNEIPMSFEEMIKTDFSTFIEKKIIEHFNNPDDEFSYNIKLFDLN